MRFYFLEIFFPIGRGYYNFRIMGIAIHHYNGISSIVILAQAPGAPKNMLFLLARQVTMPLTHGPTMKASMAVPTSVVKG